MSLVDFKFELGDKVKCIHTGFEGVIVARTEYMNGCIQYNVVPRFQKGKGFPDEVGVDEGSLELMKKKPTKKKARKRNGGPVRQGTVMRGW